MGAEAARLMELPPQPNLRDEVFDLLIGGAHRPAHALSWPVPPSGKNRTAETFWCWWASNPNLCGAHVGGGRTVASPQIDPPGPFCRRTEEAARPHATVAIPMTERFQRAKPGQGPGLAQRCLACA